MLSPATGRAGRLTLPRNTTNLEACHVHNSVGRLLGRLLVVDFDFFFPNPLLPPAAPRAPGRICSTGVTRKPGTLTVYRCQAGKPAESGCSSAAVS